MDEEDSNKKSENEWPAKEGIASIALLPSGSISGHFIQLPQSLCYGLHGIGLGCNKVYWFLISSNVKWKELPCERECSRGEDYRLIKLTITDFASNAERDVLVECKGHDFARIQNAEHAHGWEKDVVDMVEQDPKKSKVVVSFECETLKADKEAEDHIKKFMPKLAGMDAVVNVGRMSISGMGFEADAENTMKSEC